MSNDSKFTTPSYVVSPGEIVHCVSRLRELMSACDNASYILFADFSAANAGLGTSDKAALEDAIDKCRRNAANTASKTETLLRLFDKHPAYSNMKHIDMKEIALDE